MIFGGGAVVDIFDFLQNCYMLPVISAQLSGSAQLGALFRILPSVAAVPPPDPCGHYLLFLADLFPL